jgi:membrane protein implicated in regulation of membrane protease activity
MEHWKVWILAGLILGVAELLLIPAQFLLLALGVSAFLTGVLTWLFSMNSYWQLGSFALISAALVPLFVFRWRRRMPAFGSTAGEAALTPQEAEVVSAAPLTIKLKGDHFPAECAAGQSFEPGEKVLVRGFSGITAQIDKR